MHYGIVAIGSRGDVQPFIALALGLKTRGHEITLMAHENFKTFIQGYGLVFHALPGDVEAMLYTEQGQKVVRSGNMLTFMRFVQKVVAKNQPQVNAAMLDGAKDVDVLLTSLVGMIWVDAIAEHTGKRWAAIQLSFPTTPTREFPFALLGFFDAPRYNLFTYRLFDILYNRDYKKALNDFRKQLGLGTIRGSILKKLAAGNAPNLYAISPILLPRPSDWPLRSQFTGFIQLPPNERKKNPQDEIPRELIHWLAKGEKPIYIGFGSIPVPNPDQLKKILEDLLNLTKERFIFCQGWSRITTLPDHPRLYIISSVNHQWLFPHCRAAIIHGGIGTLATALRAKLPLIVASIFADQPWWGKLIEKRGLGVHLPFKNWTTERVLDAFHKVEEEEIQNRVAEIGDQMTREDGLVKTINDLEKHWGAN